MQELTWASLCICMYVHASLRDVPATTEGANGILQLLIVQLAGYIAMSFNRSRKSQCTPKRRFYCCSACGVISFTLTIFFALALVFNLTDELFFLVIKEVCH